MSDINEGKFTTKTLEELRAIEDIDLVQRQVVDRIKNNISPPVLGLFNVAVEAA